MRFKEITIVVSDEGDGSIRVLKKNGRLTNSILESDFVTDLAEAKELAVEIEWMSWFINSMQGLKNRVTLRALTGWDRKVDTWLAVLNLREKYNRLPHPRKDRKRRDVRVWNWGASIKDMVQGHYCFSNRAKMTAWDTWALTVSNNSTKRARVKHDAIARREGERGRAEEVAG